MEFWQLFPVFLYHDLLKWGYDNGALLILPFTVFSLYGYICYLAIKHSKQRIALVGFILLTILASFIALQYVKTRGIVTPLAILSVTAMPLVMTIIQALNKSKETIRIWIIATIAGYGYGIVCSMWYFMLARS